MLLELEFQREYADAVVGTLRIVGGRQPLYLCRIVMGKRYGLRYRGAPYRLEGDYRLNFTHEDGLYSVNLIVNLRPLRLLLRTSNQEPLTRIASLYVFTEGDRPLTPERWRTLMEKCQQRDVRTCRVTWNVRVRDTRQHFYAPPVREVDEDDLLEW